jgi:hypothetical protein
MPYKNEEQKKEYHREYMGVYLKKHPLTPEQKKKKAEYMKIWSAKNKDKVKALSHKSYIKNKDKRAVSLKKYREDNKEVIKLKKNNYYMSRKDYFSQKSREYYFRNKDTIRVYKKNYARTLMSRFNSYRNSAKKRGLDFQFERDLFNKIMLDKCHYCGKENAFGVDRIDSDNGYLIDNCLPCCKICNYMKRDTPYKEFISKINEIYKNIANNSGITS